MLIGSSKAVDGVTALIGGKELDIESHFNRPPTASDRAVICASSKIFSGRIDAVYDNMKGLHAIQMPRNGVAHDFAGIGKTKDAKK